MHHTGRDRVVRRPRRLSFSVLLVPILLTGCKITRLPQAQTITAGALAPIELTGAWHTNITLDSGVVAGRHRMQVLAAYHGDGTMTMSFPADSLGIPALVAYGVWRRTGPRQFESRSVFLEARSPTAKGGKGKVGDRRVAAHGILAETITLSADANGYSATVRVEMLDSAGVMIGGGAVGRGTGVRVTFPAP